MYHEEITRLWLCRADAAIANRNGSAIETHQGSDAAKRRFLLVILGCTF